MRAARLLAVRARMTGMRARDTCRVSKTPSVACARRVVSLPSRGVVPSRATSTEPASMCVCVCVCVVFGGSLLLAGKKWTKVLATTASGRCDLSLAFSSRFALAVVVVVVVVVVFKRVSKMLPWCVTAACAAAGDWCLVFRRCVACLSFRKSVAGPVSGGGRRGLAHDRAGALTRRRPTIRERQERESERARERGFARKREREREPREPLREKERERESRER